MKKCELLVPAGGKEQFIAAVENGADAIYFGGKLFNARINAGNFDLEELMPAVDFAHKRGVKVYMTMNTLIADEEMHEALEYVLYLYEIGVDALIVQDVGLAMMVRKHMPDFPLHLSAQGSVYDLRGVAAASRMGYERVVLARELTFDEIKSVCQNTDIEIEVFVHGTLCICYSGQCQMSRSFGGRSGNRGECAQPCRLPYKSFDQDDRLIKTFQYPHSPKDLCLIDHIGELAEAGVASLKIEGRMKSPEYVAIVTSIYRKYLDQYDERGSCIVTQEDREALEQIFNRGGFTEGYFYGNPGRELMAGDIPKHRGVKIGKVVKMVQGASLIDVKLYHKLSIGDGVEIRGKNVTGNVVTYYKELKGGLTRIGDIKGHLEHGDPLYKITSKEQLTAARRTFENKTFEAGKYLRKTSVDMKFCCDDQGMAKLTLRSDLTDREIVVEKGPFERDPQRLLDCSRVEKALRKTGNTPFEVGNLQIQNGVDRMIQISPINDMRRKGLEMLEKALVWRRGSLNIPSYLFFEKAQEKWLEFYFYDWEGFSNYVMPAALETLDISKRALIPLAEYETHYEELSPNRTVVPYITNISKGREDQFIEEHFDSICEHCKDGGIYIGNLSWLQPFLTAGVPVYGDYGLNVYNRYAERAYWGLGIEHCVWSLETVDAGQGAFPLMISEHEPQGISLIDRRKTKIRLIKRNFSDQVILVTERGHLDLQQVKRLISEGKNIVRIYCS